jgi:hypothetical protein
MVASGGGKMALAVPLLVVPGRALQRLLLPTLESVAAWATACLLSLGSIPLTMLALNSFAIRLNASSEARALSVVIVVAAASNFLTPVGDNGSQAGRQLDWRRLVVPAVAVAVAVAAAAAILVVVDRKVATPTKDLQTTLSFAPGRNPAGTVLTASAGATEHFAVVAAMEPPSPSGATLNVVVDGVTQTSPNLLSVTASRVAYDISLDAPTGACAHRVQIQLRTGSTILRELVVYLQTRLGTRCS